MSKEYKVAKVSEQEPKKYDGQYGTTYYIKVMLNGHSKPVEIGKKSPDAIKVGDVMYGEVIPTQYQTDKFKAEKKPFTPGRQEDPVKQDSIIKQSSMKAAIDLVVAGKIELADLYTQADEIVAWVKGDSPKLEPKLVKPDSLKKDDELAKEMLGLEEIDLDDIQF